jgi:DNA primase
VISEDKVAEVRDRTDLVALIGEYVALKRAGAQFKGLCPFHAEKSPSFHVHPDRQFFKCFGCGAAGDCISFVTKLEGRSFVEAVRFLAERAGIELPSDDAQEDAGARRAKLERERLHAITDAAAGFFVRMLDEHPLSALARAEIAKRGVTDDVARTYRLGYAPHGWDHLARFLAERGYSPREAETAGMIVPRKQGDGHYDRFRHRLMFPIADAHGRIVAFSGRALDPPPGEAPREGQDPPAKYVNSPEGPLYKKGELLFGLHEARVDLRREGTAILCEGNFDVLAVHQAGMKNVVAPLGTAFTAMQAKLLRRYVSKVTLIFDGDRAGAKAAASAYPLLMTEAIATRVAALPPGDDPDSFLRARGAEALRALVSSATPIVEHLIETAAAEAGADPAARAQAIEGLGPMLRLIPNPVEARLWVERIAQVFEIHDLEAVRRQLRKGLREGGRGAPTRGPAAPEKSQETARRPAVPLFEVETEALGLLLDQPTLLGSSDAATVDGLLTSEDLRVILRTASRMVESRGAVDAVTLLTAVGDIPARTWLEERLPVQTFNDRDAAEKHLQSVLLPKLEKDAIKREMQSLTQQIARSRRGGEHDVADEMTRRLYELGQRAIRVGAR